MKPTKQLGADCSIKESLGCQLEHKTHGCQMCLAEILLMPGTPGTHGPNESQFQMAFVSLLEQLSPKYPT